MSDQNLMGKVNAIGERLKIGGAEMSRKMSAGMSSMSFKVKEFFQDVTNQSHADKLVADATSEELDKPDWAIILHICDLINDEKLDIAELVRAVKKRLVSKSPRVMYLGLVLLEALVKNCDKAFLAVATERVLDEMVKLVDDPYTVVSNRNKALMMIEAWGESTSELRYLPVYEQTYKFLKSRGTRFPDRDNESLAPIFTPPPRSSSSPEVDVTLAHHIRHNIPRSSSAPPEVNVTLAHHIQHDIPCSSSAPPEANVTLAHHIQHNIPVQNFTPDQAKEVLDVAKNSTELLSTVLASTMKQDVLKDDLINTLVQQCRESQTTILRMVQFAGDNSNEALLFEALNVNDEIQKVLSKYEELKKTSVVPLDPELPAMLTAAIVPDESPDFTKEDHALIRKPAAASSSKVVGVSHDDMIDDLDEMIFGKRGGDHVSERPQDPKKQQQSSHYDLISL